MRSTAKRRLPRLQNSFVSLQCDRHVSSYKYDSFRVFNDQGRQALQIGILDRGSDPFIGRGDSAKRQLTADAKQISQSRVRQRLN